MTDGLTSGKTYTAIQMKNFIHRRRPSRRPEARHGQPRALVWRISTTSPSMSSSTRQEPIRIPGVPHQVTAVLSTMAPDRNDASEGLLVRT